MTLRRVTLDDALTSPLPLRPYTGPPEDMGIWTWGRGRYHPSPEQYPALITPNRILTDSLASGSAVGALTALKMLGAVDHPLWDVLAQAGGQEP